MATKTAAKPAKTSAAKASGIPRTMKFKCSKEEWETRLDLAAAFRLSKLMGWDELLFAHISARVPGEPNILMHPAHLFFEEVTASRLHKLDGDCKHVNPLDEPAHAFAFPAHMAVYEHVPEAKCVLHLHTKAGTAIAMQEQGLIPGNQYAMFLGPIRYHDYQGLVQSKEEHQVLARNLQGARVAVQRAHGFIIWGHSVMEAFMTAFIMNRACEVQLAATAGGIKPYVPPQTVLDRAFREGDLIMSDKSPFVQMTWRAWKRLLEREAPDYRT